MRGMTWALIVLLAAYGVNTLANEWYVATDGSGIDGTNWVTAFTNLQVALDTATNGDTVYVKGGTYAVAGEQLIWTNSGVTVLGGYEGTNAAGPGNYDAAQWPSILNGTRGLGSTNRIMWIQSVSDCRLERVTLCNGYLIRSYLVPGPDPYAGTNDNRGANLFVSGSTNLTLVDVTISNAYARPSSTGGYGLGAYFLNSTNVTLQGCLFTRNTMGATGNDSMYGGGLYSMNSYLTMSNCAVTANYRDRSGLNGTADRSFGVGMYLNGGAVTVLDTVISGNNAWCRSSAEGGGVYIASGNHSFRNCLIAANALSVESTQTATLRGHGVYVANGNAVFENCTIAYNFGQGVYRNAGTLALTNCILWGNMDDVAGSGVILSHCNIEDGTNASMDGNFSSDPGFERGFYLSAGSPCIDAGTNTAAYYGLDRYTTRADGVKDTGRVDIGYHHAAGIDPSAADFYVSPSGSDTNSGASWLSAFRSITKALSLAKDGTRVHIASGSYTNGSETFPLVMDKFGLQLLGTNSANTIIDANGANERVISADWCVGDAKIQGLTIANGIAGAYSLGPGSPFIYPPFYFYGRFGTGGGISLCLSSMDISDCVLTNNAAWNIGWLANFGGRGGAVYIESSVVTISNSTLRANRSRSNRSGWGGAIAVWGNTELTVVDSLIAENYATCQTTATYVDGGGVVMGPDANDAKYVTFRRCAIVSNYVSGSTTGRGAGISVHRGTGTVENSLLAYNWFSGTSGTNGGGVCVVGGGLALVNCTVVANSGEGVRLTGGALTAINCISWDNGDDIVGDVNVAYSNVETGGYGETPDGDGNISADPLFADAVNGDYRLQRGSPSMDAGLNQGWMIGATDLQGVPRILRGRVDMGCYETIPPRGTLIVIR